MIKLPATEMTMPGLTLMAPASGTVVPLQAHPEAVYSSATLGTGLSILLSNYQVFSPVAGKIIKIQNAGKEVIVATKHGVILLLSLYLADNPNVSFTSHVKQGDIVAANTLLVTYNLQQQKQPILSVVVTNPQQFGNCYYCYDKVTVNQDPLFKITAKKRTQ